MTDFEVKQQPYYRFVKDYFKVDKIQGPTDVFVKSYKRDETQASLSFDVQKGVCYDFGDTENGKTPEAIMMDIFDIDIQTAKLEIEAMLQGWKYLVPIKEEALVEYIENVRAEDRWGRYHRDVLMRERALSPEVVQKYQIGYAKKSGGDDKGRYTIPIRNSYGQIVDIKYHLHKGNPRRAKSYHYRDIDRGINESVLTDVQRKLLWSCGSKVKGYGVTRLYPLDQIAAAAYDTRRPGELLIVEGEFDALACISHGYHAVTFTGGAASWAGTIDRYIPLFKSSGLRRIVVLYDNDTTGKTEGTKLAAYLARCVK